MADELAVVERSTPALQPPGMDLNPRQRRAMRLLARGETPGRVAEALGVDKSSVRRWRKDSACMRLYEVERERLRMYLEAPHRAAAEDMGAIAPDATEIIHEIMLNGTKQDTTRLAASRDVLDRVMGKPPTQIRGTIMHGLLAGKELEALLGRAQEAGYKPDESVIDAEFTEDDEGDEESPSPTGDEHV